MQHLPFTYTIKVTNNKSLASRGTMRIFLAPKFDEKGNAFPFSELRLLMIEMDRFDLNCKERFPQSGIVCLKIFKNTFPIAVHPGENIIRRKSTESAVAIPYEQTFRNIDKNRPEEEGSREWFAYNFCGCGNFILLSTFVNLSFIR